MEKKVIRTLAVTGTVVAGTIIGQFVDSANGDGEPMDAKEFFAEFGANLLFIAVPVALLSYLID